ncbi:Diphosphomevalonate decarboxylase [Nosema bombycis CQ1]|uniref:Diphosphomevalonate decarboxylase n=1 Tax=Nosema bombycis (strain CQ1 / CVCC 102059) TaxID=578461 RepID=R0KSI4_NOSB1|nr:Diphosphomevalonate decarboxylase [Nosema bombycis CQ1]|eukprot:EOB13177.1 Diphosphomevalonate decarboxylase [Nosema bombycis CQ1]
MCSGSASRSIPKGIVLCNKEYSVSLGDLPDIKIFLIIISDKPKSVFSTEGMIQTQNSSFFYKDRLNRIEDKIKLCIESIKTKDYSSLFRMIIRDSNELHSMMFETYPPIRYITDEGYKIMTLIHKFNKNENLIAYSFDAGPNPFLFTLKENVNDLKELLKDYELQECN